MPDHDSIPLPAPKYPVGAALPPAVITDGLRLRWHEALREFYLAGPTRDYLCPAHRDRVAAIVAGLEAPLAVAVAGVVPAGARSVLGAYQGTPEAALTGSALRSPLAFSYALAVRYRDAAGVACCVLSPDGVVVAEAVLDAHVAEAGKGVGA